MLNNIRNYLACATTSSPKEEFSERNSTDVLDEMSILRTSDAL
jgi:hypothetical protein